MRIDLVGPPGAGKSTLAPKLAAELGADLVHLGSRRGPSGQPVGDWRRRLVTTWASARSPGLTLALIRTAPRSGRALRGALGAARRELAVSQASGVLVVDEGPLQAVVWTIMMSRSVPNMDDLARRLSRPDVLVHVAADPEVAVDRIQSRGDRVLRGAPRAEVLHAVQRYERLCRGISEAIGVPVVHVNGGVAFDAKGVAAKVLAAGT